jgi:hypothetical protein
MARCHVLAASGSLFGKRERRAGNNLISIATLANRRSSKATSRRLAD